MIDPLHALAFSIYENPGVYCILLGSGVSRAAEIPTGWEITLDLVRRVAALEGVTDETDWAAWYKRIHGSEPGYSDLLDQLSATPDERRSMLHSYIEPMPEELESGKKVPTKAHRAIAKLVQAGHIRVILTTNFDRLIENALREIGVEPTVIGSEDALKGAVPLIHSRCYVVKLHGDYLDTRILNTETELSAYAASMNTLLDRIIDEHGLIVCGWSGDWDPALRAAITRAPNRRYPLFWAARGKLSAVANDLVGHRAGRVVTIDGADAFFERLDTLVSAQADAQRPNPRSAELLVASAKKFLARPEFRIQLEELIGDEQRRIDQHVVSASGQPGAGWSDDLFISAVARYEARTEILARIFGILGRYGTGGESRTALDVILELSVREAAGGFTALINLRTYPAVLLFYAYGIGLLKARRFEALFELLTAPINVGRDNSKAVVSHLYLATWEGMENDPWRLVHELKGPKTALSDHLHGLFQQWTSDYIFATNEFTSLFEHFELLATLAYITLARDKAGLQAALGGAGRDFLWTPIGRAAWHSSVRGPIIESWKTDLQPELLKAGFARGDKDYLLLAIQSILALSGRISW
ncbi:SIR2 family protein [Bradyrhizobium sp. WYCCWR 13023]|uniref:SIR2 family protein n=1 Tax=Bradyrhizobium zhengyangense TaxID=2911009 RepID=A0A9X1RHP8_9BRAD|nr:SIR2 family protein [Bradyrhizobium zhengyangense]MCG2631790.1 SIR2 family protein [Bradyrhizobium zhengyangense]